MYRQGLGDCFLLSFPRQDQQPFHLLIDFGALNRDTADMLKFAKEIESTVGGEGAGHLDLVVITHEHRDHLSGFNQAREVFDRIDIGGVWMGWTEDPKDNQAKALAQGRREAEAQLRAALTAARSVTASNGHELLPAVKQIMGFNDDEPDLPAGRRTIRDALEYVRQRGEKAGNIHYLEPGQLAPTLEGVEGVRVYVLGPPRQEDLLFGSEVTKQQQAEGVVYHLSGATDPAVHANLAALSAAVAAGSGESDVYQPFTEEHRITRDSKWWRCIQPYVGATYDAVAESWRKVDDEWLGAFDQLALKLASDTNNTSLVLAFEMVKTGDVLLFVGDAQVGNWLSWGKVKFQVPGSTKPIPAHDLLRRTVFYKVGHHASHNATLRNGGLELMESSKLVGFIPLDKATAAMQGKKDPATGKPKGWQMPAKALYKALKEHTHQRLVMSDVKESLSPEATTAGITATTMYCEFTL
jgi:hypothetical protein